MITNQIIFNQIILFYFSIALIGLIIILIKSKREGLFFSGSSPINNIEYVIGKICMWGTFLALILQSTGFNLRLIKLNQILELTAFIIVNISFLIFFASFFNLGQSLRVGLPKEKTNLMKNGIYRFCRNPMYLSFYLIAIASVIYTLNPIVLIFAIVGITIHHKIVLGEESFLKKRFKKEYDEYYRDIGRYF